LEEEACFDQIRSRLLDAIKVLGLVAHGLLIDMEWTVCGCVTRAEWLPLALVKA